MNLNKGFAHRLALFADVLIKYSSLTEAENDLSSTVSHLQHLNSLIHFT